MPHSSRHPIRMRPRPRTASALLALALSGCAVPHKVPVPPRADALSESATPATLAQPVSVAEAADAPTGSVVPSSPLGDPAAPSAPLASGDGRAPGADRPDAPASSRKGKSLAQGMASWYGPGFHGRRTANGERYDMHALTAAHKTLPFGTKVRVRSVHTGKEVVVRINDRGPYKHQRIIDLSRAAMVALGALGRGVTEVELLRE